MYYEFILKHAPLILTQIDRDVDSKTYGCCDRNHWHLKIRDFASAILQQSGLTVLMLYQMHFDGNIYEGNPHMKEWAEATVKYWSKIQLRDGSYNEYYPWEHGFPPTAFSLYTACEIYKRAGMEDDTVRSSIKKTAAYLCNHIEKDAYNQEIASITALYNAYLVLKDEKILAATTKKLDRILALQDKEGWFAEYGGADIGYLSVSFDMLAEYYWLSKDEKVLQPLKRLFSFIKYFIHPDGTIGGEYGSRNTVYLLPNGFEVMAQLGDGEAEAIVRKLFSACDQNNYFLDSVDDRYLSHYIMHSFCRALEKRINGVACEQSNMPYENKHLTIFKSSGLISYSNTKQSAFISLSKGGIIKVYVNEKEKFVDCGYRIVVKPGIVATTNWQDNSYNVSIDEGQFAITGFFNKISQKVPSPFTHIPLRVVSFLVGNKIIHFLKKKIILVDKHIPVQFTRIILIDNDKLTIQDTITNLSKKDYMVKNASNVSLRHVASGKFFTTSDLLSNCEGKKMKLEAGKQIRLNTVVSLNKEDLVSNEE